MREVGIGRTTIKLRMALIHNHSSERNDYLRPRLDRLALSLQATLQLFSWQPPVVPHSVRQAFERDCTYRALAWQWSCYRKLSVAGRLRTALSFVPAMVRKYILDPAARNRWQRFSFVETVVTAKHLRAWEAFVESDADYLMCFEDDAIFYPESQRRLTLALDWAAVRGAEKPTYLDLAGGLDAAALCIDRLVEAQVLAGISYAKPVTNTACVYLLSRAAVKVFLSTLQRRPELRLVGIDWLMNAMFIDMNHRGVGCGCLHASPSAFGHGTFTGHYVSWQKP